MDQLLLRYQGRCNDAVTGRLVGLLDAALLEQGRDRLCRLRVKSLAVAQIQNIQRHSALPGFGSVHVGRVDGLIYVETVNSFDQGMRAGLESQLDHLARLDARELQGCYREGLRRFLPDDQPLAGLGLLPVFRHSIRPPRYCFESAGPPGLMLRLRSFA